MQVYSNPERENDEHALPDVEVFYVDDDIIAVYGDNDDYEWSEGYYWQSCFPGCLPDSDPIGPFATAAEAIADARNTDRMMSEAEGSIRAFDVEEHEVIGLTT